VAELRQVIGSYAAVGVSNILALRGDPPGDPNGEWVPHPQGLQYTGQLVALARSLGTFCVGVAAYPDKHPRSVDVDSDTRFLVDKIRAGAAYAITQMLFSVDDYLRLRERMCRAGVDVPVLPGLMPITSHARLMRIHELSGQRIPTELADELYRVRDDPDAGRAIGMDHAVRMSERLLAEGAPCLHFYTFNRSKATVDVLAALGMAPALRR
jgi:methylenetetrahydrofolate reductase (NADPH)